MTTLPLAGIPALAAETSDVPEAPAPGHARFDLSQAERVAFFLPEGAAVRATLRAGGVDVDVVEDGIPKSHGGLFPYADCYDAIPFSSYWVPVAALGSNTAPACQYDLHTAPADEFYFWTYGDWYGWADAYDHATGSYVYMECLWYGEIYGYPWGWWPNGYSCYLYWTGVPPPQYTLWDSLVGNAHSWGATYIAWY